MLRRKGISSQLLLAMVMILFFVAEGFTQEQPVLNFRNRGAQYLIGREDELLIKVNIWGFVRMPGQYLVPNNTDLVSLISYAGGPSEDAQITKVKLIRTIDVTPDGKSRGTDQKIYIFNIKKFLETGDIDLNPPLMPNDTILISGSSVHLLSRLLDFGSRLTFIAQIYFWVKVAR